MKVTTPTEEFLKMQNEKLQSSQYVNSEPSHMNRHATDFGQQFHHIQHQIPVEYRNPGDNSLELLKHIGTALVAMVPLGSAYISLNNSVLESSIKIQQLEKDKRDYEEKINAVVAKMDMIREENRSLKEDIDSVLGSVSQMKKRNTTK